MPGRANAPDQVDDQVWLAAATADAERQPGAAGRL